MSRPRRDARVIVATSAALTVATMPVFLLGALSETVGADLGIGEAAVGGAATVLLGTAGVVATTMGRVTERIGAPAALRIGIVVAGVATVVVGAFARSWWHIAVPFACVGVAVGLIDTGAARTFADHVRPRWQGTAFGIKEASVPAGSLLAGVALPTVAATFGWRTTFVAAVSVAVAVLVALPRRTTPGRHRPSTSVPDPSGLAGGAGDGATTPVTRATMVRFAVGVGIGAGSVTAGATFLVPSVTSSGLSSSVAGVVLSVASVASIAARIASGWWSDRPGAQPARIAMGMMLVGGVGAVLLALPEPIAAVTVAGAVVVLGAGWGWTGLAFLTAVRARPGTPAAAAGVVLTGLGVGGAAGPTAFGALVEAGSYELAWGVTAVALLVAGLLASSTTLAFAASRPATTGRPGS